MGTMDVWYAHLDEDDICGRDPKPPPSGRRSKEQARARRTRRPKKAEQASRSAGQGGQGRREDDDKAHTATACRHCPSSPSWSTASTGSSASRRSWCPLRDLGATYGMSADETGADHPRPVPRLPRHAAGRPAAPAGAVRGRRRGPQGRRRRQRRHPGVHRPAAGPRRARPAVPAGQGGHARRCWRTTCRRAAYEQPGERVVQGQRLMQAASDIFLGWTKGVDADRHFYWRQLRDMKGSARGREHDPRRARPSTPDSAAGRSPARTPAPAIRSRSRSTWATATRSTGPSPTSPPATPTRTSRTRGVREGRAGRAAEAIEGV